MRLDSLQAYIRPLQRIQSHLGLVSLPWTDSKKSGFVAAFGYFAGGDNFELAGQSQDTEGFTLANPKRSVLFSVMALCSVIYLTKGHVELRKIIDSLQGQFEEGPKRGTFQKRQRGPTFPLRSKAGRLR